MDTDCTDVTTAYTDGDWETKLEWEYIEKTDTKWSKFEMTKTSEEYAKYGPLAQMSYFAGVITGRQMDFDKALYNIQNNLSTEWDQISRPTDRIGNCGTTDETSTDQLDATSIVELKLVIFIIKQESMVNERSYGSTNQQLLINSCPQIWLNLCHFDI